MSLPSDEYVRVSHFFTGVGAPTGAAVVYCVHIDAAQPVEETAAQAHLRFGDIIVPFLSTDITMSSTLAKEGPDETGASALVSAPTYAGETGANCGTPGAAILISKNTNAGGRRGRGRMYLPGIAETTTDDGGVVEPNYLAQLQVAVQAWYEALGPDGIPLYLEHGPSYTWTIVNGQPRRVPSGAAPDPTLVTSVGVQSRIATQRRRQRR